MRVELDDRWLLCRRCIDAIKCRGEKLYVGDLAYDMDEAEEENIKCEFCEEYDDLYECL